MKKLLALFALMTIAVACGDDDEKDPCEDVFCENSGTCIEGTCDCPQYYEGTACGTYSLAKYEGTYRTEFTRTFISSGSMSEGEVDEVIQISDQDENRFFASQLIGDVEHFTFTNETDFVTSGEFAVGTAFESYVSGRGSFDGDMYEHWDTTYDKAGDTATSYQYVKGIRIN